MGRLFSHGNFGFCRTIVFQKVRFVWELVYDERDGVAWIEGSSCRDASRVCHHLSGRGVGVTCTRRAERPVHILFFGVANSDSYSRFYVDVRKWRFRLQNFYLSIKSSMIFAIDSMSNSCRPVPLLTLQDERLLFLYGPKLILLNRELLTFVKLMKVNNVVPILLHVQ